ncbi:MAG: hypothetical protein BWY24_00318 [Microgenomates group bacterium ADurb.Bin219]|nr:MAG: hypothetical protein BWY24_00318 [Microgenomates group bacterium ADurb.Bin219]
MKKNKVGRNLAKSWLGKEPFKVGQKVDEMWMKVGQLLVKSWSAFKANEVGQYLDKSWTDFGDKLGQRSYKISTDKLLQLYSNITPEITGQRLRRSYTNPTPKYERFSLKKVSQELPNDYPENMDFNLNKSGQNQHEIGTKISRRFVGEMLMTGFGKVSVWVRYLQALKVVQFLGKTGVDLRAFYPAIIQVIQPLSFIAHSLIAHNKRVSYGYTKVTPTLHQECYQLRPNATGFEPFFSLFDIARVSVYVVLPGQSL